MMIKAPLGQAEVEVQEVAVVGAGLRQVVAVVHLLVLVNIAV